MAKKAGRKTSKKSLRAVKTDLAQEKFLESITQWANITEAAKAAGVARSTHYVWLKDPIYRKRFLEARESAYDRLEQEAFQRAMSGSDRLLTFLLAAYRPKFRVDAPPPIAAGDDLADIPDDKLLVEAERELKAMGHGKLEDLWEAKP